MEVIVDDTQLSLAIGKRGQNVRLAAKLLGLESRYQERRRETAGSGIADGRPGCSGGRGRGSVDYGLPVEIVDRLVAGGVPTVERLGNMTPEQLEDVPGIDAEQVEQLRDAVIAITASTIRPALSREGTEELEQQSLSDYGEPEAEAAASEEGGAELPTAEPTESSENLPPEEGQEEQPASAESGKSEAGTPEEPTEALSASAESAEDAPKAEATESDRLEDVEHVANGPEIPHFLSDY